MVQLYIDGKKAVLEKGTNIQLVFENTYFTKTAVMSYDIKLPMSAPENCAIYGTLNRHDIRQSQREKTATLSVAGKNFRGTVKITKVDEEILTVQFVVNLYQLPDNIANLYIDELNMGTFTQDSHKSFPVLNLDTDEVVGDWKYLVYSITNSLNNSFTKIGPTLPAVHPYFLYVLNSIFSHIGYTIGTNVLNIPFFQNMIIVRAVRDPNIKSHLPHWTLIEYIQEIEQFAGVKFVFRENNVVDIINFADFINDANNSKSLKIVDEFECEVGVSGGIGGRNVGYDIDSDNSHQWTKIDESIIANSPIIQRSDLKFNSLEELNEANIYELYNRHYIVHNFGETSSFPSEIFYELYNVNQFRSRVIDPDAEEKLLRIVPVAFCKYSVSVINKIEGNDYYDKDTPFEIPIMCSEGQRSSVITDTDSIFNEITNNDDSTEGEQPNENNDEIGVMRVAFVGKDPITYRPFALSHYESNGGTVEERIYFYDSIELPYTFPEDEGVMMDIGEIKTLLSQTPPDTVDGTLSGSNTGIPIDSPTTTPVEPNFSLELYPVKKLTFFKKDSLGSPVVNTTYHRYDDVETIGQKQFRFNDSVEYTKNFISGKMIDPSNSIFLINGKRFICKQITVEINDDGIVPLQEGVFYMLDD